MKLHDAPFPHFCYHLECDQRFLTQQELKEHIGAHRPFRPQCPFTNCEKLFSNFQGLFDHEWRHYIPAPQREELEFGPNRQKKQSDEAPWKQRVKVEEIWLQSKKRESPTPDHAVDVNHVIKTEEQTHQMSVPNSHHHVSDKSGPMGDGKTTMNGYKDATRNVSHSSAAEKTPSKRSRKRMSVELDPLNVRDLEDLSTLVEGVQQKLGEPHITEHKTFRPEDPSYSTFVKAPFIRPPPSTYLDESVLSMRKRRSTDEAFPKKNVYWSNKKKSEMDPDNEQPVYSVEPEQKVRQRCDKCLSSFSSIQDLQKHQALNTCSALFGFDSDDESKYD